MSELIHQLWQKTLPWAFNRWRHRHGFGVQSPWAYHFVRDVLFEPLRYYAFDELEGGAHEEQLFRLALWLPTNRLMVKDVSDLGIRYLLKARRTLQLEPFDAAKIQPETVLVVEDIRHENRILWHEVVLPRRDRTSAFDLGHRGIAFFDSAHQRQVYYL